MHTVVRTTVIKEAVARIVALPVVIVSHHINTKYATVDPKRENNCPLQKKRYCLKVDLFDVVSILNPNLPLAFIF
jgi:hypothetical protein